MAQQQFTEPKLNSMQVELFSKLVSSLNADQKLWLGGYLTGLNSSNQHLLNLLQGIYTSNSDLDLKQVTSGLKILYGTRSGNSLKIANRLSDNILNQGLSNQLVNLNDYDPRQLKKEEYILIVVSTDGDGEPPIAAQEFYEFIHSKKATRLDKLKYSVLALGDSSYQYFCKTGKDIDKKLEELGAKRIHKRFDCDVNFEPVAEKWISGVSDFIQKSILKNSSEHATSSTHLNLASDKNYSRKNPYQAKLLDKILLNGRGSTKETYHVELSIEESGLNYQPGDAVGIPATNPEQIVDELLSITKLQETDDVLIDGRLKKLREALIQDLEITRLTPKMVKDYAALIDNKKLNKISTDSEALQNYIWGRDAIDLFSEFPETLSTDDLMMMLPRLQPRLYSIASSLKANPDEVHLCLQTVRYHQHRRDHLGAASTYLADERFENESVPLFIDENISFRLPEDHATSIIMIGAGTGIAPYRAFLQERNALGASGKNWLIFGERQFTTDFLYQTEIQKFHKNKTLNKLDLAFSRDQDYKVYVQHRIQEKQKELYAWLEEGAHIYICGDKNTMARDVHQAILEIICNQRNVNEDKAMEYLKSIKKENRFHEDVY